MLKLTKTQKRYILLMKGISGKNCVISITDILLFMNKNECKKKKLDMLEIYVKFKLNMELTIDELSLLNTLDEEEKNIISELIQSKSFEHELIEIVNKLLNDSNSSFNKENTYYISENSDEKNLLERINKKRSR